MSYLFGILVGKKVSEMMPKTTDHPFTNTNADLFITEYKTVFEIQRFWFFIYRFRCNPPLMTLRVIHSAFFGPFISFLAARLRDKLLPHICQECW